MPAFLPAEALFLEAQDKGEQHDSHEGSDGGQEGSGVLEPSPPAGFGLLLSGGRDQVYSSCIDLACPLEQRKTGHMGLLTVSLPSYRKDLTAGWCYT